MRTLTNMDVTFATLLSPLDMDAVHAAALSALDTLDMVRA